MPIHNITTSKGVVPFIAAKHLYTLKDNEVDQAKKELQNRFDELKPKSIVVEGFEVGHPMPCRYVLSKAIEPDKIINSESDLALKIAFDRKIAIIPGDSQKIDKVDFKISSSFSEAQLKKLEGELKILDFLHSYYLNLREKVEDPISVTLTQLNEQGIKINKDEVLALYKNLNGKELPSDARSVYEDFTPPKYLQNPKGTNLLVAKQDKIRNQGLVTAIQIGLANYGTVMPIYGSGHLPEVAPFLEKAK